MSRIIVAIDGPAASGKSTTARRVANYLGYIHLNSGLLYRTIAWVGLRDGWIDEASRIPVELAHLDLTMERQSRRIVVRANGEIPGAQVSSSHTAIQASRVAARVDVREKVLDVLRTAGRAGGVVCDGRDIGTVVFPTAELKIFLVASAEERARRRLSEYGRDPDSKQIADEIQRLAERDARDADRDISPLRRAPEAIEIDTTRLTPDEVVNNIVTLAVDRGAQMVDDFDVSV